MFYGFPSLLMSPAMKRRQEQYEAREKKRRLEDCKDWKDNIPFEVELNIRGETYKPKSLFEVKPSVKHPNDEKRRKCFRMSPSGQFCYYERILPKGLTLTTAKGRKKGTVIFDSDVIIPCLYERHKWSDSKEWEEQPWMSTTPQEIFTLRTGTRFAKGAVVIGGLGMGYQLEEVCKRGNKVKKVIVVERSEELVEFIWPTLDLSERDDDVEFIIGDAKEEIPELEADSALIDIYPSYGGNIFPPCPNIRKVWVWGSQYAD